MSERDQSLMFAGFAAAIAAGLGVGGFLMNLFGGWFGTFVSEVAYFFAILAFGVAVVAGGFGAVFAVWEHRNVRSKSEQQGKVVSLPPRQGPR